MNDIEVKAIEFIKEPQAEYEEVYLDGKLISKLERFPIEFKPTKKVAQAIENLIARNKELEERDLRKDELIANMSERHFHDREKIRNSIPKSVIKEKIEELNIDRKAIKREIEEAITEKNKEYHADLLRHLNINRGGIQVLEELLKGE